MKKYLLITYILFSHFANSQELEWDLILKYSDTGKEHTFITHDEEYLTLYWEDRRSGKGIGLAIPKKNNFALNYLNNALEAFEKPNETYQEFESSLGTYLLITTGNYVSIGQQLGQEPRYKAFKKSDIEKIRVLLLH